MGSVPKATWEVDRLVGGCKQDRREPGEPRLALIAEVLMRTGLVVTCAV
jgi:hypothetical protein